MQRKLLHFSRRGFCDTGASTAAKNVLQRNFFLPFGDNIVSSLFGFIGVKPGKSVSMHTSLFLLLGGIDGEKQTHSLHSGMLLFFFLRPLKWNWIIFHTTPDIISLHTSLLSHSGWKTLAGEGRLSDLSKYQTVSHPAVSHAGLQEWSFHTEWRRDNSFSSGSFQLFTVVF